MTLVADTEVHWGVIIQGFAVLAIVVLTATLVVVTKQYVRLTAQQLVVLREQFQASQRLLSENAAGELIKGMVRAQNGIEKGDLAAGLREWLNASTEWTFLVDDGEIVESLNRFDEEFGSAVRDVVNSGRHEPFHEWWLPASSEIFSQLTEFRTRSIRQRLMNETTFADGAPA